MEVAVRLLAADGSLLDRHTFRITSTAAVDELVLEHTFDSEVDGVARLRVETMRPGWVIWYEIEAYGPG